MVARGFVISGSSLLATRIEPCSSCVAYGLDNAGFHWTHTEFGFRRKTSLVHSIWRQWKLAETRLTEESEPFWRRPAYDLSAEGAILRSGRCKRW